MRLRVGPALYQVMAPGEQILAGAYGVTGLRRPWSLVSTAIVLMSNPVFDPAVDRFTSMHSLAGFVLTMCPAIALALEAAYRRRRVFLAVTDRQLICIRMSSLGTDKPIVRVPREMVVMRGGPGGRWTSSVTYLGPRVSGGRTRVSGRGTRVGVAGAWRQDLDDLVGILQAAGIPVDGYIPGGLPSTARVLLP